jgi:hypothetical protein
MKRLLIRLGSVAVGAPLVLLAFCVAGSPRSAARAGDAAAPTFVGSANCKKCHLKQYKSWAETKMGKAFSILKPGEAKEAKEKAKLDATKDYSKDAACVKCHTTGYGEPGGYPKIGDPAFDAALATDRENVQCEMCHGPGGLYSPYMKEHEKDYKSDEAVKLGLVKPDGKSCTACHKGGPDGSPTVPADFKFDGAAKLKEPGAAHEHYKIKK